MSVSEKHSTCRQRGLGWSTTGLDMMLTANHNLKIFKDIKCMVFSFHFLSYRLLSKLLTVWVRDYWLNLPALSVARRKAPTEETLDAAELEVERRE